MDKKKKYDQDPYEDRKEHELDVDRMISEGMAGGTTYSIHGRMQIEQARELPEEDEPFPEES
ncbi:hypothetical protein NC661_07280 [Aquibacillus koreensis]|uniref:DUF4025 domain-containing protein n=1 Tax=Aquibacillus koreensis TaxID=279446 RepID=A0A9X3WI59_9BACI|nr:hypothetical protein [Aquibacillus koreensis]MCT2535545.1 hypothetical protein [Aquibacillus koreensis]MDC3420170.1 hypothetical protein [Aquibacillus koreensis]